MKTSNYLDALRARHGLTSDYQTAKLCGFTKQSVSRYRLNKTTFDNMTAKRVSELLEIEPMQVIADMQILRSKTPEEKEIWRGLLRRLTGMAAALLLGFGVLLGTVPAPVSAASTGAVCILC